MVELWLLFALGSMLAAGVNPLIHRYVTKDYDWLSYAFFLNVMPGIFFLLISINDFTVSSNPLAVAAVVLGSFLWASASGVSMKASQLIEASERIPLKRVDIIFTLFITYLLLAEPLTSNKLAGAALILAGTVFISYERGKRFARLKDLGTQLTILGALISAVTLTIDKFALGYWDIVDYSALVFLFPAIILGAFMLKSRRKEKLERMIRERYIYLIGAVIVDIAFFFLRLNALALAEASVVFLILRVATLVTVFLGIILLHERTRIGQKVFSALLMIAGATLVAA